MTAAEAAVDALLRGIAQDGALRAAIAYLDAIAALAMPPLPLRHRRGRAVSRAAKRRRVRASAKRMAHAEWRTVEGNAWGAVVTATGWTRESVSKGEAA